MLIFFVSFLAHTCHTSYLTLMYNIDGDKMSYKNYNANPIGKHVGDCTVRAVSKALDYSWDRAYAGLIAEGYYYYDMPSANVVWGAYLRHNGFKRYVIPDSCPDDYTVIDFCNDHPKGTYVLALDRHVICVVDGDYYDTWDSGKEIPIYYWTQEEN